LGLLGQMALTRDKAAQAPCTEPGSKPLDQFGKGHLVPFFPVKAGLAGGQRIGGGQEQADAVIAEAGVERVGKAGDALVEQAKDQRGIAGRAPGLDIQTMAGPIAAMKREYKAPAPRSRSPRTPAASCNTSMKTAAIVACKPMGSANRRSKWSGSGSRSASMGASSSPVRRRAR
jgi:hypothetical protein